MGEMVQISNILPTFTKNQIMSSKKSKKRWWRWIIYSVIFLVIAAIIVIFGAEVFLEKKVKNEISKYFRDDPSSMYDIEFVDVRISVWQGDFKLDSLRVEPKPHYIDSLKNGQIDLAMHVTAERFVVNGLDIWKLLRKGLIKIKDIELKRPVIKYVYNPDVEIKSDTKPLNEILTGVFVSASIKNLDISDADILVRNIKNEEIIDLKIDSASLYVRDIFLDTSSLKRSVPLNYNDLHMDVRAVYLGSLAMYSISFDKYEISVKDSLTSISNFKLIPKYSKDKFNEIIGHQGDRFNISSKKITIHGFDIFRIIAHKRLDLNYIEILNPELEVYRDNRMSVAPFKYKPLMSETVRDIPFIVDIDSVILHNGKINYQEFAPKGPNAGEVILEEVVAKAYNVTNDAAILKNEPDMTLDAQAKLMGKALFKVACNFPILDPNDHFDTKGSLGSMQASAMNPFVGPVAGAEIKSGEVLGVRFHIYGDNNTSGGTVDIEYKDLKIDVLSAKKEDKSNWFLSVGANTVIRTNNLKDTKKYREGEVYFERRKDKAFINFFVKSLVSGLQSTVAPITVKKETRKEEKKEKRRENGEGRTEKGERRRENGEGRTEKGERRRENGEGRTEKGEWRRIKI